MLNSLFVNFPIFDPGKLTDIDYLLEPEPQTFSFAGLLILLLLIVLVISAVFKFLLRKKYINLIGTRKVILNKWLTFNLIASIVGLLLAFIRLQGLTYLSMRVVQLVFVLGFLFTNSVFLFRYFRSAKVGVQVEKGPKGVKNYQSYLPKKNRRK